MEQDSKTTSQSPTHRDRFEEACRTNQLERHNSPARHSAYEVRITNSGQKHYVEGPFFTHTEAAIWAEILRKSCKNARATSAFYQDHPAITQRLIKDCQDSRARLAQQINLA